MRPGRVIICKVDSGQRLTGSAFFGINPVRPRASFRQLRSAVSAVPKCEAPGPPAVWHVLQENWRLLLVTLTRF